MAQDLATMKLEGDTFYFADPAGMSYTAASAIGPLPDGRGSDGKLDGTETPFKGDLGSTTVSVQQVDQNTVGRRKRLPHQAYLVHRN